MPQRRECFNCGDVYESNPEIESGYCSQECADVDEELLADAIKHMEAYPATTEPETRTITSGGFTIKIKE